jgi:hypothetical protein
LDSLERGAEIVDAGVVRDEVAEDGVEQRPALESEDDALQQAVELDAGLDLLREHDLDAPLLRGEVVLSNILEVAVGQRTRAFAVVDGRLGELERLRRGLVRDGP